MKKLLVVVDYQNDFVNGSLGFEGAELLDERIAAKVEAYRAEGADIMYTMDTHGSGYLEMQEGRKLPVVHCQNGTEGWKLYGKTGEVCKDAMTIGKHTFAHEHKIKGGRRFNIVYIHHPLARAELFAVLRRFHVCNQSLFFFCSNFTLHNSSSFIV